jgi:hypothetical protein
MLAYVFWHWPRVAEPRGPYESTLIAFHRALAEHRPPGFRGSRVLRTGRRPWAPAELTYEDWYFVEDFAALGALNEAAVAGPRKAPHDSVAALPLGGAGGLYLHRGGDVPSPRSASFRSKPSGVSDDAYVAGLPLEIELWQRQMVLGPAPEFCLLSHRALSDAAVVELVYAARSS